jgi:hypothetical protein
VVFRVGDHSPIITSISPNGAYVGETVSITITGTAFGINPTVAIDGLGIVFTRNSSSDTHIEGFISIDEETYAGIRGIKVISLGRTGLGFQSIPTNSNTSNVENFNVVPVNATITTSTTNVRPAETTNSSTAQISVCLEPALSNKRVTLSVVKRPQYIDEGGHVETSHDGTRPLGKLTNTSGTTGGNGCFSTTYTPSHIAGTVGVNGSVLGFSGGVDILVGFTEFVSLPEGTNYVRIGESTPHPKNNWGKQAAIDGLIQIANKYKSRYYGRSPIPEDKKLRYNDTSLPYGGKFDLAHSWSSTGSHAEHREGINTDVRCCADPGSVPTERWEELNLIFFNNGSTRTNDETQTSAPHWHLRFEFGSSNKSEASSFLTEGLENNPSKVMEINEVGRTPHDFIEGVYWAVLGRESDQKEYEKWLTRITEAKSSGNKQLLLEAESLVDKLFNSEEYWARQRTNEEFTQDVFWAHLFRNPSKGELSHWLGYTDNSVSKSSLSLREKRNIFLRGFRLNSAHQLIVLNLVDPKYKPISATRNTIPNLTEGLFRMK